MDQVKTTVAAKRRLDHFTHSLKPQAFQNDKNDDMTKYGVHTSFNPEKKITTIRIGDVSLNITESKNLELVPEYLEPLYEESQEILRHLRWMMQKDKLGQDIFLIGALVLRYAQLTNREIEYVPLSKDCTDSDLRQRREISGGTAYYVDQACVRAAINGRILILDGIEKAERNVLPILNNLLENREMALEDGRFLVHPKRYDLLMKSKNKSLMKNWKLVKTSERFIVVALGLPIPPYVGHPLDPPLRSRFQSRDIKQPSFYTQVNHLKKIAPVVTDEVIERLVSVAIVLRTLQREGSEGVVIPEFPLSIDLSIMIIQSFPNIELRFLLDLLYPWPLLPTCENQQMSIIEATYHRFGMLLYIETNTENSEGNQQKSEVIVQCSSGYQIINIKKSETIENPSSSDLSIYQIELTFKPKDSNNKNITTKVFGGAGIPSPAEFFVETDYHKTIFNSMLIAHSVSDFCVIGVKGCGKSALIRHFAKNLGYTVEYIPLYKDMSARDLLQHRSTTFAGDTVWEDSLLIKAALSGNLAIMDGIDTLSYGTLVTLQRLIKEREISLPNGNKLIHPIRYKNLMQKYGFTDKQLHNKGIFMIHPAFRIVTLARPVSGSGDEGKPGSWLSPEIVSLFHFIVVRPLKYLEEMHVLESLSPGVDRNNLSLLLQFANRLRQDKDETIKMLSNALSTRQLIRICRRLAVFPDESLHQAIHKVSLSKFLPSLAKDALEELLVKNGEHLLLIGNQGVGKNKLADYFLQLLKLPREYIQLHRDTTVQSLTVTPSIVDGVLQFEDSPLVRAVKNGYILVVDEADKAPTYVTSIIRNLLEDGQMVLGDGRRILSSITTENMKEECIVIHRNFRMIVLANRPGYPFLVDNPGPDSEMFLLRKYAPDVPEDLLLKLTAAFSDLRKLVDEGLISYPYSTRELVNVVKHMQEFPKEGIARILQNIFDFDQYDQESKELLFKAFEKHGIPVALESEFMINLGEKISLSDPIVTEVWTKTGNKIKYCEIKKEEILMKDGWEIPVGTPKELERTEGRTMTFTEQTYSFKIPTRGEALDIVGLSDGSLFVVTTNPITLHAINQNHRKIRSMDLYEYFPLQKAPPGLKMTIVQTQENGWYLLLHDPIANSLLCIDFARSPKMSVLVFLNKIPLTGLNPTKSVMLKDFESTGILVFYQSERSTILMLDFNINTMYTIEVPVKISKLFLLKPNAWLLRDSVSGHYHIVYANNLDGQNLVPNIILQIDIKSLLKPIPDEITFISQDVFQQASFMSTRFLQSNDDSIAASIILNSPETLVDDIKTEIISYMRKPGDDCKNCFNDLKNSSISLKKTGQLATVIPLKDGRSVGNLEIFNPVENALWRITIPLSIQVPSFSISDSRPIENPYLYFDRIAATLLELPNGDLLTMDISGVVRIWQVDAGQLILAANTWRKLVGNLDQQKLSIIYETDEEKFSRERFGNEVQQIFQDRIDGGDSLNLMGREPTFIDVSKLSLRTEIPPPIKLTAAQRDLHELTMRKKREQINMTQENMNLFQSYLVNVQKEIHELRVILESIEAKKKERVWLKNQSSGDIDDTKLIEGLTGESNIYKRRGDNDPDLGFFQDKPKKMVFAFDLSARFNSHDRRLDRSMENKFQYRIVGHSGDSPNVEFVKEGKYPRNEKEEFKILSQMYLHSQFCLSGDNTLNATANAIKEITKEEADDYFVVILSDANIAQYNINPTDISKTLKSDDRVNAFIIFIGSIQNQAERLRDSLTGHAHVCMDNKDLPKIMKSIFLASMLKG
ncbi:2341_t:CDS:10 [Entrophospora sp. SA101]|nr:2341_t:CDS:10 [Entrophospora sp. SA101]